MDGAEMQGRVIDRPTWTCRDIGVAAHERHHIREPVNLGNECVTVLSVIHISPSQPWPEI
jgi:hypothetical protein